MLTGSGIPAPDCYFELNSKLNLNYSECGGKPLNIGVGMWGSGSLSQKQVLPHHILQRRGRFISFQGNMLMVNTV